MTAQDRIELSEIQHHLEVIRIIIADMGKSIPAINREASVEMLKKRSELAWALTVQLRGAEPCG